MDLLQALFMVLQCQHVYDLLFVANLPDTAGAAFQKSSDRLGRAFASNLDITLRARLSLQPGLSQGSPLAKRALTFVKLDGLILSAISRFDVVNVIFATKFDPLLLVTYSELPGVRALFVTYVDLLDGLVAKLKASRLLSFSDDSAENVGRSELNPASGIQSEAQTAHAFGVGDADIGALLHIIQRSQTAALLVRGRLIELDEFVTQTLADVPNAPDDLATDRESPLDQEVLRFSQLLELLDRFFEDLREVMEPFCQQLGVPGLVDAVGKVLSPEPAQFPVIKRGQSVRGEPLKWLLHLQGALTVLLDHHGDLMTLPLPYGSQQAALSMTTTIGGSHKVKGVISKCRALLLGSAHLEADLRQVSPSRRAAESSPCGKLLWRAYEVQASLLTSAVILTVELLVAEWLICQCTVKRWQATGEDGWISDLMHLLATNLESIAWRFHSDTGLPSNASLAAAANLDPLLAEAYLRKVTQEGLAFNSIYKQIATTRHIANQLIKLLNEGLADSLQEAASDEFDEFLRAVEPEIDPVIATLTGISLVLARLMREQGYEDLAGVLDRLIPVN